MFCTEKPVKPVENTYVYIFSIIFLSYFRTENTKNPKIQDFQKDTRLSFGLLDSWIFGFLDFWTFGFLDFWIFGFLDFGQYKLVLPI